MATTSHLTQGLVRAGTIAALLVSGSSSALPAQGNVQRHDAETPRAARPVGHTRKITITYTTHDGRTRNAYVLLPHDYRPGQNPPIPLVISPHGRAVDGEINTRRYGDLPSVGGFAVVNPDGFGRKLPLHSWGAPEQIADLARMPEIVESALPWVHIDRTRLYAIGGSMGAQETLLLVGRYPHLLAGAVAVDGPADFALQYRNFARYACDAACLAKGWGAIGPAKQKLARKEIGGTPETAPAAYAERSPISYAARIAASCVPLQIWWSKTDATVLDPERQSGRMFRALESRHPRAAVDEYVGHWKHTDAMRVETDMPKMLAGLGLLPEDYDFDHLAAEHHATSAGESCTTR